MRELRGQRTGLIETCLSRRFLQSLTVVFRLRLKNDTEALGLKKTQARIHKFIYYPILFVTVASGLYLAIQTGVFDKAQWIYPKLGLLAVLIALGEMNRIQIKKDVLPKKYAMMVHIAIFIIAGCMIYLATVKPF